MSNIHLFFKQKELNAQEKDKYQAIQEFKCNVSPSNLDAEDYIPQIDQTQQQMIAQDKAEICFELSSNGSKIMPDQANQNSDNSITNIKKSSYQNKNKQSSYPAMESLVYSQTSQRDKKNESKTKDMNKLKEFDDFNSKFALDSQSRQLQININSSNDERTIKNKYQNEENQENLYKIEKNSYCDNSFSKNSSNKWNILKYLMKIIKNQRMHQFMQKISSFIGDKSYFYDPTSIYPNMSKQFNQKLSLKHHLEALYSQNKSSECIQQKQQYISLVSIVYDVISLVIEFISIIYFSIILVILPSYQDSELKYRFLYFGIFLTFYVLDILKELISVSFHSNQRRFIQLYFIWKQYLRTSLFSDISSLLSIIIIEIAYDKLMKELNFISFVLVFLISLKLFTITKKWKKLKRIFQYSLKFTIFIRIFQIFTQTQFIMQIIDLDIQNYYQFREFKNILFQYSKYYSGNSLKLIQQYIFISLKQLIGQYNKQEDDESTWINIAGLNNSTNFGIVYVYAFQSCFLQVFHEIIYLPQTENETYFFYFLQFILGLFGLFIINTSKFSILLLKIFNISFIQQIVIDEKKFSKQHYQEYLVMCQYIGEKNMNISQKLDLFNMISIKMEQDKERQNIQIYKEYSQNISKPLSLYFQMIYLEQILNQKSISENFTQSILKKCCKIIEEKFYFDNEIIYDEQSDLNLSLFIIIEGRVSVFIKNQQEQTGLCSQFNAELNQGQIIGYKSFFTGMRQDFLYKAHDKVRLLKIQRDKFIDILFKDSKIDYEKFCEIKDRIIFENNNLSQVIKPPKNIHLDSNENIKELCLACKSIKHDIIDCEKCHLVVNKLAYIISEHKNEDQERVFVERQSSQKMKCSLHLYRIMNSLQKFKQKNKNYMLEFEKKFLIKNYSNNSKSFFNTSEQQIPSQISKPHTSDQQLPSQSSKPFTSDKDIPSQYKQTQIYDQLLVQQHNKQQIHDQQVPNQYSKPQTPDRQLLQSGRQQNIQALSDNHKKNSNKLTPVINNHTNSPKVSGNIQGKELTFSIQSLIYLQMQESKQSPMVDKTHNSNPQNTKAIQQQNAIQEESFQSNQISKGNTLAQLFPEKIHSDLNNGINIQNSAPQSPSKQLILKKQEDGYEEYQNKTESPFNSQYNVSKLSNMYTSLSKQNINQNQGDFKSYVQQQQQKNDIIILQVEENQYQNTYEFNLSKPIEQAQDHPQQQKKNNPVEIQRRNQSHLSCIKTPSQFYYNQDLTESIQGYSNFNSNNYVESTAFNQIKQYINIEMDKQFITQNYFPQQNIDVILNILKEKAKHIEIIKPKKQPQQIKTNFNKYMTFNQKSIDSPNITNIRQDNNDIQIYSQRIAKVE